MYLPVICHQITQDKTYQRKKTNPTHIHLLLLMVFIVVRLSIIQMWMAIVFNLPHVTAQPQLVLRHYAEMVHIVLAETDGVLALIMVELQDGYK